MNERTYKKFYEQEGRVKRYAPSEYYNKSILSLLSYAHFENALDIGCGDGNLCKLLKMTGTKFVVGMDISGGRLKYAQSKHPDCEFEQGSIYDLAFKDNSFDLVTAVEIIEHLENPSNAIGELKRVSKEYVLIQVPYNEIIQEETCPHCLKSFYPRGHIQSFDESRLRQICEENGLTVIDVDMFFHAFDHPYIRWIPSIFLKRIKKLVFTQFMKHGGHIGVLCKK